MDDACGRLSRLLSARVDDELSADESLELNAHLEACPSCAASLRRLEATVAAVRSLPPVEPPPGYLVDLRARQTLEAAATPWLRYLRDGLALAGATALLGLMALGLRPQATAPAPSPLFASASPSRPAAVPEPALVVAQAPAPSPSPLPSLPSRSLPIAGSPSSSSVSFLGVAAPVTGGTGPLTRDAGLTAAVDSRAELASLSRQAAAVGAVGEDEADDDEFGPPVLAGYEGLRNLFGSLAREVAPGTPEADEELPGRILLDVSDEPAFFAALKADLGRRSAAVLDGVEYVRGEETRLVLTMGAAGTPWSVLFTDLEAALWRMPSVQGVLCVADDDGTPGTEARVMVTVRPVPRRP